MKIYVVTEGSYSDYHICCVCSTKERADEAIRLYGRGSDAEEFELDDIPNHPTGCVMYSVTMWKEGMVGDSRQRNPETWAWRNFGQHDVMEFYVWATDSDHAVKIANEIRTRLIAADEWGMSWPDWQKKHGEGAKP